MFRREAIARQAADLRRSSCYGFNSRNARLWNGCLRLQNGCPHGVRLMLALGCKINSKGNDDLTELAAVLQIAVHFHHIVELEYAIDDRLERAARKALGDVLHRDLPACLVAGH